MSENKNNNNIIIAVIFCLFIWILSDFWMNSKTPSSDAAKHALGQVAPINGNKPQSGIFSGAALSKKGPFSTVAFDNKCVEGAINLQGPAVCQWALKNYRDDVSKDSPMVRVLRASSEEAVFGWYGPTNQPEGLPNTALGTASSSLLQTQLPDIDTQWSANGERLTPNQPLTLSWTNPHGVLFQYIFTIDDGYMLTVRQKVFNKSDKAFVIGTSASLLRLFSSKGGEGSGGQGHSYEGPIGVFSRELREAPYKSLLSGMPATWRVMADNKEFSWMGFGDKYWLGALVPQGACYGRFSGALLPHTLGQEGGNDGCGRAECVTPLASLAPGQEHSITTLLFAGPKSLKVLDGYQDTLKICRFDGAVDFGWSYFMSKPLLQFLSWLKGICGSFAVALIVLTVLIKLVFFPLSLKSYRSMAKLQKLSPHIERLKSLHEGDKGRLSQETIALYKREGVNPVSGCLPMLVQLPVFFALYKVLMLSIEMRHAPFFGWIHDLSAPDPTSLLTLFGLIPVTLPKWLHIGIWPGIMGLSMIGQQKMTGTTSASMDKNQALMLMYLMPGIFTFTMAQLPVGLVIYWTWSNVLSMAQQWICTRYYSSGPSAEAKVISRKMSS